MADEYRLEAMNAEALSEGGGELRFYQGHMSVIHTDGGGFLRLFSGHLETLHTDQSSRLLSKLDAMSVEVLREIPEWDGEPEPPVVITPTRRRIIVGLSNVPDLVQDPVEIPESVGVVELSGEAISTSAVQLVFQDAVRSVSHQYRINGGVPLPMPMDKAIRELAANTNFTFEVRGLNALGPGDWSNTLDVKTWQEVDPNDIDGDGIPNINDPDHPDYDPTHPDSDPDGDGLKNKDDPDDNNDGVLDINDPTHPDYDPNHPDSPDYQAPADPLVAVFSPKNVTFSGWVGSYGGGPKYVQSGNGLTYGASGGTPPYNYGWVAEPAYAQNIGNGFPVAAESDVQIENRTGGFTKFGANVPLDYIVEQDLTCTITDARGQTTSFTVRVSLTHGDLR